MKRPLSSLFVLAVCGLTLPAHDEPVQARPKVTTLTEKNLVEQLDGKKARVTMVEVTLEPGQASTPHRHPGPVFGYVLEGTYAWATNDEPAKTLHTGDTFYEPTGCVHRVSKNAGTTRTRVLAVILHGQDSHPLSTPEPKK